MKYHIPGNEEIMDEIYVVISKDKEGEGIVSMMLSDRAMPLVFGKKEMLEKVLPLIKKMADETGQVLQICKYKKTEVVEEVNGSN